MAGSQMPGRKVVREIGVPSRVANSRSSASGLVAAPRQFDHPYQTVLTSSTLPVAAVSRAIFDSPLPL